MQPRKPASLAWRLDHVDYWQSNGQTSVDCSTMLLRVVPVGWIGMCRRCQL
jgi:hypothetical protein